MLLLSVPVAVITRRAAATQDAAPRLADDRPHLSQPTAAGLCCRQSQRR